MHFKLSLFALSSLAVFVAANHLAARQDGPVTCATTQNLQCCRLVSLDDDDTRDLLKQNNITSKGLTGRVGTGCGAGGTNAEEPCSDDNVLACCPKVQPSTTVSVNCTAMTN